MVKATVAAASLTRRPPPSPRTVMARLPRYFAYGRRYFAPAPYVCVSGYRDQEIVYPLGVAVKVEGTIQQWIDRVQAGEMCETTREEIAAAISAWNERNRPPLDMPA
jgi:hypothetical protein